MFSSTKRSALISWLLHCGAILLILAVTGVKPSNIPLLRDVLVVPADIVSAYKSPLHAGGGGGGGVRADSPASKGEAPPFARFQYSQPTVEVLNTQPILPMAPTLIGNTDIPLTNLDSRLYGDPSGLPGKLSGGRGDGGGIGDGHNGGVGPGNGPGLGLGNNGGAGGGEGGAVEYRGAGGGVTAPILLTKYEPEYSEEARKSRLQGTVLLRIEVDTHGIAQNITVGRSLGLGLDERAIQAVQKWKFSPGKVKGRPATVVAYVEVNFRLL